MSTTTQGTTVKRDRTHYLYIAVIVAVVLGPSSASCSPTSRSSLKWIGTAFVALIKMMIQPVIFCTLVLGVGSVRSAASVGKVGGLALAYFLTMSTVALAIGMVVGNILDPGEGLNLSDDVAGRRPGAGRGGARLHDRVHHRHRPRLAALVADLGRGPPDPARRAAGRLRPAGDGPRRPADPHSASATCSAWSSGCWR